MAAAWDVILMGLNERHQALSEMNESVCATDVRITGDTALMCFEIVDCGVGWNEGGTRLSFGQPWKKIRLYNRVTQEATSSKYANETLCRYTTVITSSNDVHKANTARFPYIMKK